MTTGGLCRAAIVTLAVVLGWQCGGGGGGTAPTAEVSRVVDPQGDPSGDCRPAAPCSTIARAAEVARAGDVVLIKPGTYTGDVRVHGSGTPEQPIVFTAERPGSVVLVGHVQPADWPGDRLGNIAANPYVTWRGLVVHNPGEGNGPQDDCLGGRTAVRMAEGWRLENMVIEQGQQGAWIGGNDTVIEESIFQDLARFAFQGTAANVVIRNNTIRRINTGGAVQPACGAVTKIVFSDGYLIEGNESYDNVGPGLWLDGDNKDYVIRNNVIRNNRGLSFEWEGAGLWLEGNPASNGQVYGNTFADNTGSGLGILETVGVEVFDNTFAGNPTAVELRNIFRGEDRVLRDISIHDNTFESWTRAAVETTAGDWDGWSPSTHDVRIESNAYTPPPGLPVFLWLDRGYAQVAAVCSDLGFEPQACGDRTSQQQGQTGGGGA